MIEVRCINSTRCREVFTKLWHREKGSSPKDAEVKGNPGQSKNICLTVALAESYHNPADISDCLRKDKIAVFLMADACIG